MRSILLDAGPLIALFSTTDKHHTHYDALVADLSTNGLRLLTTWPCVVEASYLLGVRQRFELLTWIELGGAIVYPFHAEHLAKITKWMQAYTEAGKRWTLLMQRFTGLPMKQVSGR